MTSSKNVFIQLDKENLSSLGELSCNANLNELAQHIADKLKELSDAVDEVETVNSNLKISVVDLVNKYNLLLNAFNNLDIQNAYIDFDLGCLTNPCANGRLSILTILQIFKNEICKLKTNQ